MDFRFLSREYLHTIIQSHDDGNNQKIKRSLVLASNKIKSLLEFLLSECTNSDMTTIEDTKESLKKGSITAVILDAIAGNK